MPVSKISIFGESSRKAGGSRWIDQRSTSLPAGGLARRSARRSRSRAAPASASPTGTEIGAPVSTTSMPRARPSVESMATARTRSSPRCCCTSAISVRAAAVGRRDLDRERVVDLGQRVREDGVDDDALDLDDPARVRAFLSVVGHGSPGRRSRRPEGSAAQGADRARSLSKRPARTVRLTHRAFGRRKSVQSGYPGRRGEALEIVLPGLAVVLAAARPSAARGGGGSVRRPRSTRRRSSTRGPRRFRAGTHPAGRVRRGLPRSPGRGGQRSTKDAAGELDDTAAPSEFAGRARAARSLSASSSPLTSRGRPTRRATPASTSSCQEPAGSTSRAGTRSTRSSPTSDEQGVEVEPLARH